MSRKFGCCPPSADRCHRRRHILDGAWVVCRHCRHDGIPSGAGEGSSGEVGVSACGGEAVAMKSAPVSAMVGPKPAKA